MRTCEVCGCRHGAAAAAFRLLIARSIVVTLTQAPDERSAQVDHGHVSAENSPNHMEMGLRVLSGRARHGDLVRSVSVATCRGG